MSFNVKLNEIFLEWEENKGMFNYRINNFPVFLLLRPHFFSTLENGDENLNLLRRGNYELKNNFGKKISSACFAISSIIRKYQYLNNVELLGISSALNRIQCADGYYDKFLSPLYEKLSLNRKSTIIEFPYFESRLHYNGYNENIIFGDIFYFMEKLSRKKPYIFNLSSPIAEFIADEFCILYESIHHRRLDKNLLTSVIRKKIVRNIHRLEIFQKYFKEVTPKHLVLVSFYSPRNTLLTYLFKSKGTMIYDIQHSHIYPNHFSYILPLNKEIRVHFFPDKFLVQGEYYKKLLAKSIPQNDIIVTGKKVYPKENIINNEVNYFIERNSNRVIILIINQFTISKNIYDFLASNMYVESMCFIIKLHPRNIKEQLNTFKTLSRKHIYISENDDLDTLVSNVHAIAGVYSTGLIDALKNNKPVFRIKNDKFPQLDSLVEEGIIIDVTDVKELYNKYQKTTREKHHKIKFYQDFSIEEFKTSLKND